ncbi:hypothetical protein N0V88_004957 [Collariella sp. IMI 366227]|nr:hypothetical protein N0V88_004957 [Collariella sp. IMI 366227]
MALRITPADTHHTSFTHISSSSTAAPSAPASTTPSARASAPPLRRPHPGHLSPPLESRLKNWEATREALRMETLRRAYGMAEPIRRGMELKITKEGSGGRWRSEILRGRDETITWEDVYTGEDSRAVVSVQEEMERKLKM